MGELSMINVVVHHDHSKLPSSSNNILPVHIYGLGTHKRTDVSTIGHQAIDKIQRLGVKLSDRSVDFLTIALSVTAADTFVLRDRAADGWAREINLKMPLVDPAPWIGVKESLENTLHFLSGDIWKLEFLPGGYPSPEPYVGGNFKLLSLRELDCVALFSGGLDSCIGTIDLIEDNRNPLLVSHSYRGDKSWQEQIAGELEGRYSRFYVNADPHSHTKQTDLTMRTRSINFLAFAVLACDALASINQIELVDLFVPENGFISLNAPLTPRRIGSLSTRTTHPYYISSLQSIFDSVGINVKIKNPYQFKTKGEMVLECSNFDLLKSLVDSTVSCSRWKRSHQQCGGCVPCLIRRASLKKGGINEATSYKYNNLQALLRVDDIKDDLLAVMQAISQLNIRSTGGWILDSGPIPPNDLENYKSIFIRGLTEVSDFLQAEGI